MLRGSSNGWQRFMAVVGIGVVALGLVGVAAAGGGHGKKDKDATPECTDSPVTRPFVYWEDVASYTLVPGGTFDELTSGWKVGSASVVEVDPALAGREGESHFALALPPGGRATSPKVCVSLEDATFRFLYARTGSAATSALRVEVGIVPPSGGTWWIPVRELSGSGSWQLSPVLPVVANFLNPFMGGEPVQVAFRFTALGPAEWLVDDVYLDPYKRV